MLFWVSYGLSVFEALLPIVTIVTDYFWQRTLCRPVFLQLSLYCDSKITTEEGSCTTAMSHSS